MFKQMFIIAYLFTIASFGPSHACAWDVLVPLGVANMLMYPINLSMRRHQWILLIPAILLHIFYPVIFRAVDGFSYFDHGGVFIPNWTAKGVLGNLFITGYCPVFGLLPFELTGMVFSHYILEDKKSTRLFSTSAALMTLNSLVFIFYQQPKEKQHSDSSRCWSS